MLLKACPRCSDGDLNDHEEGVLTCVQCGHEIYSDDFVQQPGRKSVTFIDESYGVSWGIGGMSERGRKQHYNKSTM